MNVIIITGNLTKDSELRHTQDGTAVLSFDVANNQGFGDKQRTEFYKCTLWGKRGESLSQYLTKGVKVAIEGQHTTDRREHEGKSYFDSKIKVSEIELLSRSDGASNQANHGFNPQAQQGSGGTKIAGNDFDDGDSIPF